jgi:putative transposase
MKDKFQNKKVREAVDLLVEGGVDLSKALEKGGLIKELTKAILERAMEVEMSEHLGYELYERSKSENARNSSYNKNLITESGFVELDIPRDREGSFEPAIVPKRQTRIEGSDQKILSLYAKGMSLSDIRLQLKKLYAAEVSESLISKVTDGIIDEVRA